MLDRLEDLQCRWLAVFGLAREDPPLLDGRD